MRALCVNTFRTCSYIYVWNVTTYPCTVSHVIHAMSGAVTRLTRINAVDDNKFILYIILYTIRRGCKCKQLQINNGKNKLKKNEEETCATNGNNNMCDAHKVLKICERVHIV